MSISVLFFLLLFGQLWPYNQFIVFLYIVSSSQKERQLEYKPNKLKYTNRKKRTVLKAVCTQVAKELYQQKCSKICKQNLRRFLKFSLTQLTVTKLKLTLSSHFKVCFFVVLLFSFKTTFSFHFKTLTVFLFQSSHQTYHDKYICIYIYLYILYY